ncbi:MAG: M24 family metallopeptidase [Candidatus Aminicenantales bacterium]
MKSGRKLIGLVLLIVFTTGMAFGGRINHILPLRERARVVDQWLKRRLNTVLPKIMEREGFDMWLVICREYNEDPVFMTLVPATFFAARRLTMLVFYLQKTGQLERIAVSRYPINDFYEAVWNPAEKDQWSCLAKVIKERNPRRIGINVSETFAFGDGLSAYLEKKLREVLGSQLASRLHPAERVAVGWLEYRLPEEIEVYHHIAGIAHQIIKEAFSASVITPGVTTIEDVEWWFRERIDSLGLNTWFQPSVSIQRPADSPYQGNVIHRGDLLHCDVGITYLRLNTDTQEHAYVLKEGEKNAPEGLKKALAVGNRLQDILIGEFKAGRTGNEILAAALQQAREEGIEGSIYSHPLGFHGHAAGPTIGLWDKQDGVPGKGDYPLFYQTAYSIELNVQVPVPEWGKKVRIALEQDAVFTKKDIVFLDGRQTSLHIIR